MSRTFGRRYRETGYNSRFHYAEKAWSDIEVELVRSIPHEMTRRRANAIKADLESMASRYLAAKSPKELHDEIGRNQDILDATTHLIGLLEKHDVQFTVFGDPDRSLIDILEEFSREDGFDSEDLASMLPAAPRENRNRNDYLDSLCAYWRDELMLSVGASVDPQTGVPDGPLVRYLMTATDPILGGAPLTAHMARAAIRSFKRITRVGDAMGFKADSPFGEPDGDSDHDQW